MWVALEEWKLRLTSAKVEVEVKAELGNNALGHFTSSLGSVRFYKSASNMMNPCRRS